MSLREGLELFHKGVVYPILTRGEGLEDREVAHERGLRALELMQKHWIIAEAARRLTRYRSPLLETDVFGLHFNNPVGFAAGFDKNGRVFRSLAALGFGHVEVGTVTAVSYEGNPRPRVRRLEEDRGMLNRMGFPGEGYRVVRTRLSLDKIRHPTSRDSVLGLNFGASGPSFERGSAVMDTAEVLRHLGEYADYTVVNVSSPNTPGVRALQEPEALDELLSALDPVRRAVKKPLLLKVSPDLSSAALDKIIDLALQHNLDGMIATNTSTNPELKSGLLSKYAQEQGGVSGRPIRELSSRTQGHIYQATVGRMPCIAVGGIYNAATAWQAISRGGASLVQIYTAFVEKHTTSPFLAYQICKGIEQSMKHYGFTALEDFRGTDLAYPGE